MKSSSKNKHSGKSFNQYNKNSNSRFFSKNKNSSERKDSSLINSAKKNSAIKSNESDKNKSNFSSSKNRKPITRSNIKVSNKASQIYQNSSISVVPSRWEEPFGRTAMESSAHGCATITSNRGGLTETFNNNLVLNELTVNSIY